MTEEETGPDLGIKGVDWLPESPDDPEPVESSALDCDALVREVEGRCSRLDEILNWAREEKFAAGITHTLEVPLPNGGVATVNRNPKEVGQWN